MSHVLSGDVGGTRARFAIFEVGAAPRLVHQEVLESRAYRSFEAVLTEYLSRASQAIPASRIRLKAASFGIAGPVVDQRAKTTNLPWVIDAKSVSRKFSIPSVTLLNDLVAVGLGALSSPPSKLAVIHGGRPKRTGGTIAVIAAGTGLGEAVFVWDGAEHIACATEGSHVEFAPRNKIEDALLLTLRKKHGHVSYERLASGSTIAMLYRFFINEQRVRESKAVAAEVAGAADANVAVVELAESGRSEAAMRAIELWSSIYGAETGNLVLKSLSTAGVLVCGGVSARLAPILANGLPARKKTGAGKKAGPGDASPFIAAFLDKGRMRPLLETIPVAVCLEPRAGLLGAATHAIGSAATKRR